MKLFHALLLGLLLVKLADASGFILDSDIENAIDDGITVEAHDSGLEATSVQNHDHDFDELNRAASAANTEHDAAEGDSKLRHPFDIDKFLNELDAFDCDKRKAGTAPLGQAEQDFNSLCATALEEQTFQPLGNFDADPDEFYGYLDSNIYKPLAYSVDKKDTLSDVLKDLIFIDERSSMIGSDSPEETYANFETGILDHFAKIQGMTSDMDSNHDEISKIMVQLLKRFHIYWNTLRSKDQIDKVKVDTKEVMRNILKEYEVKEKFLFEVTQALAGQIKDAYTRFLTAHQSVRLLNIEGPSIIASRLLDRYRTVIEALKSHKYSFIQFVRELALLTDLQQAYYVINYKLKSSESQNIQSFQVEIFNKIQPLYLDFVKDIPDDSDTKTVIKHFTATLMLKMKQTQFLIFSYHGIAVFVNFNRSVVQTLSSTTVKVYYDLLNNLMLVPKTCVNMLMLKQCAVNEVNKALRMVGSSYMLKRSTGGWGIYTYTHDMIRMLFSKADDQVFSNWTTFKVYYYENLFSIATNLKQRFLINDLEPVDDLEAAIGQTIEKFKADNGAQHLNFGLIDEFDSRLYHTVMDIKANFNKFDNIKSDPALLMQIRNVLFTDFKNFEKKFAQDINQDFVNLLDHVRETIEEWRGATINAPNLSIQVAELPMHVLNTNPQTFHSVVANGSPTQGVNGGQQRPADVSGERKLYDFNPSVRPNSDLSKTVKSARSDQKDESYSFINASDPPSDIFGKMSVNYDRSFADDNLAVLPANLQSTVSTLEEFQKNEEKKIEAPKERFPIVPQHNVTPDPSRDAPEVSLESGISDIGMS